MRRFRRALALSTLALTLTGGLAIAQDHHDDPSGHHENPQDHHGNDHYVKHEEWRKGSRMNHDDWNRGERVDYRHYHLSEPPHGYEWRQVDGNYVLAAVATGVIASVVVASTIH